MTSEIGEVIAESGYSGMRTFDQSLLELVTLGDVTIEEARQAASEPHDFELMLQQAHLGAAGAEGAVPLSFASDIKPLFRREDQIAMGWAFDLWYLDSVRANAAAILDHLERGNIPVDVDPWPDADVELFRTWMHNPKP
jgi:hypothetical protein